MMRNRASRPTSANAPYQGVQGTGCSRHGEAAACLTRDLRLGGLRLVPSSELVARVIADVPSGRVITLSQLIGCLTQRFGGDRVGVRALHAALRDLESKAVAALEHELEPAVPVWRLLANNLTVDPHSALNPLFAATRLRAEGHCLTRDHGRWKVCDPGPLH
ncbi:MAG: hypothetical protein RR412_12065 [Burkholderiaceae bacterium]